MIYSTRQTHLFAVCIRAAHFAPLNGQQIIIVEIYNRDGRAIGQNDLHFGQLQFGYDDDDGGKLCKSPCLFCRLGQPLIRFEPSWPAALATYSSSNNCFKLSTSQMPKVMHNIETRKTAESFGPPSH